MNILRRLNEKVGAGIIRRAVEAPLRQLADNAGQEGALIVQEVKSRGGNEGYNVTTGEHVDFVKAGVVDPTKVTHSAAKRGVHLQPPADDRSGHHGVAQEPSSSAASSAGGSVSARCSRARSASRITSLASG